MKRIGVLTSGGDAPGMNAAIRAVTRMGINRGWDVIGIYNGYTGMLTGDLSHLVARRVGGIMNRGGTVLGSSRCPEFETEKGRRAGLDMLSRHEIEAAVIVGGGGSQTGSYELSRMGFPVVGIASTIDNDLYGPDITIGADTALNVALEAIDRLKVTATSHHRAFLVEVMGRDCGYLALMSALAGGADAVVVPEVETDAEQVATILHDAYRRGKPHALVVVSEGAKLNAEGLGRYFHEHRERLGFELRSTVLGHVQRGAGPGAFDRVLGTESGIAAARCLEEGQYGVVVGLVKGKVSPIPLADVVGKKKPLDTELLKMINVLSM